MPGCVCCGRKGQIGCGCGSIGASVCLVVHVLTCSMQPTSQCKHVLVIRHSPCSLRRRGLIIISFSLVLTTDVILALYLWYFYEYCKFLYRLWMTAQIFHEHNTCFNQHCITLSMCVPYFIRYIINLLLQKWHLYRN